MKKIHLIPFKTEGKDHYSSSVMGFFRMVWASVYRPV